MGDFNMCVDASQFTSEHSILDNPEQLAWDSLDMEFLKLRFQCQSYRYAKMRQLRDRLIDNQCQSHLFFQALYPTYA